jgi:hypothetical protein
VKAKFVLIMIALSLYSVDTKAYTRLNPDFHHFFSVDGALGYASLLNNSDTITPGAGVSIHVGAGYRLFYNNFLFATGVEMQYLYNQYSMSGAKLDLKMRDTEGDPFIYHIDATEGQDQVNSLSINLPLLFGAEYKRFYFLAGPKFSLNLWNNMQAQSQMIASAEYGRYIDIFEDMPNHMLGKFDIQSPETRADWDLDVIAHVEIGARVGKISFESGADIEKPKHRVYLALYADYGLFNLNQSTSQGYRLGYEQTPGQPLNIYLTPALMSKEMSGIRVNQFCVGIKATVLLELPTHGPCVICKD